MFEPRRVRMRRSTKIVLGRTALALFATVSTLAIAEGALRGAVEPSGRCFGRFRGQELPPCRLLAPDAGPALIDSELTLPPALDGTRMTRGDLWGAIRLDVELGYTYRENASSANGWWRSNNLGARSNSDASHEVPPGRRRLLVFGDSFAHGSRLPQDQTWPQLLEAHEPRLEVENFGVDGYGMGQAFLRFRALRTKLRFDAVLLLFVPDADLWRDLNVMRQLEDPRWDMPLMPRFELQGNSLRLVRPLYGDPLDLYAENREGPRPELVRFLRAHDRLYFPSAYEQLGWIGGTVLGRIVARADWQRREKSLRESLMAPEGEALQVSRAIFATMAAETAGEGASFALAILPIDAEWWSGARGEKERIAWNRMVSFLCSDSSFPCIDLFPELLALPPSVVDRTEDDWHFGPRMNGEIASAVARRLELSADGLRFAGERP